MNEKEIERTVIRKANEYISFKFGNVQFLDIMKFLGSATRLDSFLKAYKTSKAKGFFRMNALIVPKNSHTRHVHRTKSFSVDYVIANRWINLNLFIKVSSTLDAAVKKRWKNSRYLQLLLEDKRIIHIYSKYGKTATCNHSKTFFDGTITKMLCQRLKR